MDTAARWASYARSRTAAKRDARRRQGERWRAADVAVVQELERRWIGSDAAWRRWEAGESPDS